jgi:NitT/TauT family transport system permease protein
MIIGFIKKCIPFFLIIGIWQILASLGLITDYIFSSPLELIKAFFKLVVSGDLGINVYHSVKRVCIGFLIAAVFGCFSGIVAGYYKRCAAMLLPLCEFLRPIPPIAWIPIAILWFGLGDAPAFFIVFIGAFFPIFINTYWGVRSSQYIYLDVAHNFSVSGTVMFFDVIIPASLPLMMHGLRIGLGLAWTSVISAELIGAQNGLGYMIQMNRLMLKSYNILVGMIVIGFIGWGMNHLMLVIEKKITFWNQETLESKHKV